MWESQSVGHILFVKIGSYLCSTRMQRGHDSTKPTIVRCHIAQVIRGGLVRNRESVLRAAGGDLIDSPTAVVADVRGEGRKAAPTDSSKTGPKC